jgi:hypothetical protein
MATRKKSSGGGRKSSGGARKSSGGKRGGSKRSSAGKSGGRKTGGRKSSGRKGGSKSSGKRELISPRGNKRLVRRGSGGEFTESDDLKRSLRQDVKKKAKRKVKSGQGDRGDQQR